jgi:predicted O-methyltransferase YrrM
MQKKELIELFNLSLQHRAEHECGGYPYQHADVLALLLKISNAKKVLELGTGIGYSAAVMAGVSNDIHIDTIDQDDGHMEQAKKNWQKFGLSDRITPHVGKAEAILPELIGPYDLIFFDGHTPSMKFLIQFERLLKKGGILVTANMFLRDKNGGKYMRALQKIHRWQLATFSDTTIAVKLFDK